MSNIDTAIGERVHRVMWRRRITQTAMAERLGMSQSAISRKLRGERPWDASDIVDVAEMLDLSLDFLFFGDANEPDPEGSGSNSVLRGWGSNPRPAGYLCDDVDAILLPLPVAA